MTENPTAIAREAKTIYQSIKGALKKKEPFDKELEFQRKNLRKRYLALLLIHPYAKESKDVENHLWMQTSYAFISEYKDRLSEIDRAIQANNRQPQPGQPQQQQQHRQRPTGPVEHRKLLARFRQFLAEEERFWIQLILRMYRAFGLEEAQPALTALGLVQDEETAGGHSAFPEEPPQSLVPASPTARESRLAILSKALICLGDIARYREFYSESGGRQRAGQDSGRPPRRGRNRRGGASVDASVPPRLYESAQQRYDQARWLVPQEGNPFHQLAILATYRKDSFSSVYYYYRALCVRQPYETAGDNLATVLQKALDQWKRSRKDRDRMLATGTFDVKDRVQLFKDRVVVLHAIWRKGIDRMDSKFRDHDKIVCQDFGELVSERHLLIDTISNVVVLAQSALWKHRMIRDAPKHKQEVQAGATESAIAIEWRMLHHLLDTHSALMETGRDQLKDLPSLDDVDNDPAQRITAIFRRTLPALRIASKWLRANVGYLVGDLEFKAYQDKEKHRNVSVEKKSTQKLSAHSVQTIRFWRSYAQFVTLLSQAFPKGKLPALMAPLEEDTDLRGFLPLKKQMLRAAADPLDAPHPNEEQLMRISDLLADAEALLAEENTPLVSLENGVGFDEAMIEPRSQVAPSGSSSSNRAPLQAVPPQQQQIMNNIRDQSAETKPVRDDDAMTAITSRTDEDVLKAAFQHIGVEADEDDDIVLYNPRGSLSPMLSPVMQATPITPAKSMNGSTSFRGVPSPPTTKLSPNIGKTPVASPRTSHRSAITASDLLLDVMTVGRKPGVGFATTTVIEAPSSIQPPLLFGKDLVHAKGSLNGHSIWSAGQDEQSLKFGSNTSPNGHHTLHTSPRVYSHGLSAVGSQELNGSVWSSPQMVSTQGSQVPMGSVLPAAMYSSAVPGHHRLPSISSPSISQAPLAQSIYQTKAYIGIGSQHQDPFYTSPATTNAPVPAPILHSHPSLPLHSMNLQAHGHNLGGFQGQPGGYLSQVEGDAYAQHDLSTLGRGYHSPGHSQDLRLGQTNGPSLLANIWGNHG